MTPDHFDIGSQSFEEQKSDCAQKSSTMEQQLYSTIDHSFYQDFNTGGSEMKENYFNDIFMQSYHKSSSPVIHQHQQVKVESVEHPSTSTFYYDSSCFRHTQQVAGNSNYSHHCQTTSNVYSPLLPDADFAGETSMMTPPAASGDKSFSAGFGWSPFGAGAAHSHLQCLPTPPLPSPSQHSPCDSIRPPKQGQMSKWKLKQERERLTLPQHVLKKRRLDANARERKRMTNLNNAFARLKAVLPSTGDNSEMAQAGSHLQLADKEMSKMETLRMAQEYIIRLSNMLNC